MNNSRRKEIQRIIEKVEALSCDIDVARDGLDVSPKMWREAPAFKRGEESHISL